jgi:hypothetical protein
MSLICPHVCYFTSVTENRGDKSEGSIVGLYCIHRNEWFFECLFCVGNSRWEIASYGNRCGFRRFLRTVQKQNVSNYGSRTVSRISKTMNVVYELLHFRNNNPQLQSTEVKVTLLICFRQYPSSINSKEDGVPTWTLSQTF